MSLIIFSIISLIGVGSSLLPTLILFIKRKSNYEANFLLWLFSIELAVVNLSTFLLYLFSNFNQDWLMSIHILVESILLLIYLLVTYKNAIVKIGSLICILSTIFSFSIIYYFLGWKIEDCLSFYSFFIHVMLTIFAIIILVVQFLNSIYDSLLNDSMYLLASAVLVYNGLQIYVSIFESIIRTHQNQLFFYIWPIVQISTIFYHFLIARALWKLKI